MSMSIVYQRIWFANMSALATMPLCRLLAWRSRDVMRAPGRQQPMEALNMIRRFRFVLPLVVYAFIMAQTCALAQEPIKGLRVFSCGHSFHYFMPPILGDIAKKAE